MSLVDHGAPLDAQDSNGDTPLHLASKHNHSGIVEHLINSKANHLILNKDGNKAFQIAPEPLKSDVTEYVIDNLMTTSKTRSLRLSQSIKSVKSDKDEIDAEDELRLTPGKCMFCQACDPVFVFKPCGHVLLCDNCYINHKGLLENCPICEAFLERVESINQPKEPEPIVEDPPEEEEKKEVKNIAEEEEEDVADKNAEEEAGQEITTEGESYATESTLEST